MAIVATALWRRLDLPGHDACRLERRADGWRLDGTAVFRHDDGPAAIAYRVDCDAAWRTVAADIRGVLGRRRIDYAIGRGARYRGLARAWRIGKPPIVLHKRL